MPTCSKHSIIIIEFLIHYNEDLIKLLANHSMRIRICHFI